MNCCPGLRLALPLRELLAEQRSRVFLRKTQASCNNLSAGPVNSFRPNFATETKVPSRDTQRKLSESMLPIICNNNRG